MDVNGMKSSTQKSIETFMRASGQTVCDRPTMPSEADRLMRAKLLWEETLETISALGVQVLDFMGHTLTKDTEDIRFNVLDERYVDFEEIIDGCIDCRVIATGTLSTLGVPDMPFQLEIDQSNLRKIGPDGQCTKRDDGKLLKPCGWQPPNIRRVLNDIFPEQLTADEAVI